VLGVLWGVGIPIALSLLNFIRRAWYPHDAVLGRVENLKGYHDTGRYPDARLVPGLVLYRFDAPLFFANADSFCARVRALSDADAGGRVDESVAALQADLAAAGVALAFAELKDPVRDYLRRYGVEAAIGPERFYPTVGVAVSAYLKQTRTAWVDWEERPLDGQPMP